MADNRRVAGGIAIILLIAGCSVIFQYFKLLGSEEYLKASTFLSTSERAAKLLGDVKSTRLGYVNFKTGYANGSWFGKFHIVVTATQNGVVYFELVNLNNSWIVKKADLVLKDGESFDLVVTP